MRRYLPFVTIVIPLECAYYLFIEATLFSTKQCNPQQFITIVKVLFVYLYISS